MNNEFYTREELITPDIAREYLKFNKVNRPLNAATVEEYAEDMKKGQWKMNGESLCFLKSGALSNGQHRLNAVIRCGIPVRFSVARNCDDDSLPTYDSGRNRKPSDVFALEGIPNYTNVSSIVIRYFLLSNELNAFASSGGKISSIRTSKKVSRQDLLNEYNDSPELYQRAMRFAASCYSKLRIMTIAEVGGMYVFLCKKRNHSEEVVEAFFRMLFFYEGRQMRIVELLRDRLIKAKMATKAISSKYKRSLIVKVWNSYIAGKDAKVLKWNEETEGKVVFL